jgi:hypothetical protein
VIGPQQQYLRDNEQRLWHEGELMRTRLAPLPLSPIKSAQLERLCSSSSSEEKQELPAIVMTHQVERLSSSMDALAVTEGDGMTASHTSLFRKSSFDRTGGDASGGSSSSATTTTRSRMKARFNGLSIRTQGDFLQQRKVRVKSTDSSDSSSLTPSRNRVAEFLGWK